MEPNSTTIDANIANIANIATNTINTTNIVKPVITMDSTNKPAKKSSASSKHNIALLEDKYTPEILQQRYNDYKHSVETTEQIIKATGLPIRHQNPPEDITENIVKFLIYYYESDHSVKWAKAIGLNGDLASEKYDHEYPIEIKAFTSDGPSSFGPKKKFGVIYFLDMRGWLNNVFILWKVNVSSNSPEWKQMKMNKTQTNEEQCDAGRRPHISWDNIYSQIKDQCVKVYEGTFENIFNNQ